MKNTLIILTCFLFTSCAGFIGNMDTPYGFIKFNEKNIEIAPKAIQFNGEKVKQLEVKPTK